MTDAILTYPQAQVVYNAIVALNGIGGHTYDLRLDRAIVRTNYKRQIQVVGPKHPNDEHYDSLDDFAQAYRLTK